MQGALLVKTLLIASERNSTRVRLGKIRALLEGVQKPEKQGLEHHQDLSFVLASVCQHLFLLLKTDFCSPEECECYISHLPGFVFL